MVLYHSIFSSSEITWCCSTFTGYSIAESLFFIYLAFQQKLLNNFHNQIGELYWYAYNSMLL